MAGKLPAGTFVKFAVNSPVFRIVLQAIQDLAALRQAEPARKNVPILQSRYNFQ
jgi:hypothetical protein